MLDDETCYFLAFDFDDKKDENNIKEDILAFASICDKYNVPISIEKVDLVKEFMLGYFLKIRLRH